MGRGERRHFLVKRERFGPASEVSFRLADNGNRTAELNRTLRGGDDARCSGLSGYSPRCNSLHLYSVLVHVWADLHLIWEYDLKATLLGISFREERDKATACCIKQGGGLLKMRTPVRQLSQRGYRSGAR